MASNVQIRGGHRSVTTRIISELNGLIGTSPLDIDEIESKIVTIKLHYEKLIALDTLIQSTLTDDSLINDMNESSDRISAIQKIIIKSEKAIKASTQTDYAVAVQQNRGASIQLPKLTLPTFTGNPLDWTHFWDCFESAVHSRTDLSGVQKFNYFTSQLKGDAAQLLDGFALTNSNYEEAIALAKETYGKPHKIIKSHLHALFDLDSPKSTSLALQKFRSSYECHIRALKTLGTKIEDAGFVIVALLMRKLPNIILNNINRASKSNFWTLDEFRSAINVEIEHLSSINTDEPKYNTKTDIVNTKSVQNNFRSEASTASSLVTSGNTSSSYKGKVNLKNQSLKGNEGKSVFSQASTSSKSQKHCKLCNGVHYSTECTIFSTGSQRLKKARELKLCGKCLSKNHSNSECTTKFSCYYCNEPHNSALCFKKFPEINSNAKIFTTTATVSSHKENISVALPTANLSIFSPKGVVTIHALFDLGSQRSFLLKSVAQEVNLQPYSSIELSIDGFSTVGKPKNYDIVKFDICTNTDKTVNVNAILIDKLPDRISAPGLESTKKMLAENGVSMADSTIAPNDQIIDNIALLIGADYFYNFVLGYKYYNGVNLLDTKVGHIISGPIPDSRESPNILESTNCIAAQVVTALKIGVEPTDEISLDDQMRQMWTLDAIGIKDNELTKEEAESIQEFDKGISFENDRYVTRLPWRRNHAPLPTNLFLAKNRLISNLKSLRKTPELLQQYDSLIKQQLERDFIEKVDYNNSTNDNIVHYLPHHGVKKASATTPLRLVYACNAKLGPKKPSLNDCLLTGPSLMYELPEILLRFRLRTYACVSDIAKAYHMIGLNEKDRDATRFLWPKDPHDINSALDIYRFKVVLFGATCSQFLLNATINHHLSLNPSLTSTKICRNIYVDNLQAVADKESELIDFYHNSKALMNSAGLTLREWTSNSAQLNKIINETGDGVSKTLPNLSFSSVDDSNSTVLGMKWNTSKDILSCVGREFESNNGFTKRLVLSHVARTFDPLGLITPITITSRILMQKLWKLNLGWDEIIPDDLKAEWLKISPELQRASKLEFPRNIMVSSDTILHAFCDASNAAYGAVIYATNTFSSNLLISKGRVTPLKSKSIPRLELIAANLAARLVDYVTKAYKDEFTPTSIHLWTDSQVVLRWLASTKPLEVFVQNRVDEIHHLLPKVKYHYICSKDNPSDLLSRGTTYDRLSKSDSWFHGPSWLKNENEWPVWLPEKLEENLVCSPYNNENLLLQSLDSPRNVSDCKNNLTLDTKSTLPVSTFVSTSVSLPIIPSVSNLIEWSRFSSYKKLLNVFTFVHKFVHKLKIKINPTTKRLDDTSILEKAEHYIIAYVQSEAFSTEKRFLLQNNSTRKPTTKSPSLVNQLNLQLTTDNLICCHGRLEYSDLSWEVKYPILIPCNHPISELITRDVHQSYHHIGLSGTVANLRQRWWFSRMRQRVKAILRACIVCKKLHGRSYPKPPEAPLPAVRVQDARPFQTTGIDYTGALSVKSSAGVIEKAYIALFTCTVTRAIHLEIVDDNSAEAFLRAFRRFVGRRSTPRMIISDNASTFAASAVHLEKVLHHPSVTEFLKSHHCVWKFIVSRAPWCGGFWERLIGITKNAIKKSLGKSLISPDELRTLIVDIEASLNDRPLTYSSGSLDDIEPLTPSHLLHGFRLSTVPVPIEDIDFKDELYLDRAILTKRQLKLANILENFQVRWQKEYLTSLRERQTSQRNISNFPNVGDIVQIYEELPRSRWKLGLITELHRGLDGFIRSATLKTSKGILNRAVVHLYPLEINAPPKKDEGLGHTNKIIEPRLQRAAAIAAKNAISKISK